MPHYIPFSFSVSPFPLYFQIMRNLVHSYDSGCHGYAKESKYFFFSLSLLSLDLSKYTQFPKRHYYLGVEQASKTWHFQNSCLIFLYLSKFHSWTHCSFTLLSYNFYGLEYPKDTSKFSIFNEKLLNISLKPALIWAEHNFKEYPNYFGRLTDFQV